jgi:hypothetical protein
MSVNLQFIFYVLNRKSSLTYGHWLLYISEHIYIIHLLYTSIFFTQINWYRNSQNADESFISSIFCAFFSLWEHHAINVALAHCTHKRKYCGWRNNIIWKLHRRMKKLNVNYSSHKNNTHTHCVAERTFIVYKLYLINTISIQIRMNMAN